MLERMDLGYLNSEYCSNLFDDLESSIRAALQRLDDKSLTQIHISWTAIMERREYEMMKNIRIYSIEQKYDTGVFLIGAAHRKAIIQRISKRKRICRGFLENH